MITNETVLELAKEHLEYFDSDSGADCAWSDFAATKEQLISFAQAVWEEGYDDGCFDRWIQVLSARGTGE